MKYASVALLCLVGVAALVTGVGSYTSAQASRTVRASVVDDDRAYLGVSVHEGRVTANTKPTLLTVTNRFHDEVAVSVAFADRGWKPTTSLDPGESMAVRRTLTCSGNGTVEKTFDVTITADGDGLTARKHLDLSVECVPPPDRSRKVGESSAGEPSSNEST